MLHETDHVAKAPSTVWLRRVSYFTRVGIKLKNGSGSTMPKHRIAIVGAGNMARARGRAFLDTGRAEICGVAAPARTAFCKLRG